MPLIPALGRMRQGNLEFEASLDHMVRHCLKANLKKPKTTEVIISII
jgi:hypothetical protein